MAADQAQSLFDERIRRTSPQERRLIHDQMQREAFLLVWAAADRAGPMPPLDLARFLLERLYPDLRGPRLDALIDQLAALERQGRWAGPERPRTEPEPALSR